MIEEERTNPETLPLLRNFSREESGERFLGLKKNNSSAEIPAHIKILPVQQAPLYQKLAQEATKLRFLGMTYEQIAESLNINKKTAIKACKHKNNTGKYS